MTNYQYKGIDISNIIQGFTPTTPTVVSRYNNLNNSTTNTFITTSTPPINERPNNVNYQLDGHDISEYSIAKYTDYSTGNYTSIQIPPDCRSVSVFLVGGGASGQAGGIQNHYNNEGSARPWNNNNSNDLDGWQRSNDNTQNDVTVYKNPTAPITNNDDMTAGNEYSQPNGTQGGPIIQRLEVFVKTGYHVYQLNGANITDCDWNIPDVGGSEPNGYDNNFFFPQIHQHPVEWHQHQHPGGNNHNNAVYTAHNQHQFNQNGGSGGGGGGGGFCYISGLTPSTIQSIQVGGADTSTVLNVQGSTYTAVKASGLQGGSRQNGSGASGVTATTQSGANSGINGYFVESYAGTGTLSSSIGKGGDGGTPISRSPAVAPPATNPGQGGAGQGNAPTVAATRGHARVYYYF